MVQSTKKMGPLDVVEVPGTPRAPVVVLFHGFGADCYDLAPLSQVVSSKKGTSWYFPNGPLDIVMGPGMRGRAWFQIDIHALEEAMRLGRHRDMSNQTPPGLEKAKMMAHEFLQSIGRPPEDIIIGGFSQGAMLATELALSSTTSYRALVVLSGVLLRQEQWKRLATAHEGMPFFQSHGTNDVLLDPKGAEKLSEVLTGAGLVGHLEMFRGGHEIPQQIVKKLGNFILNVS